MQNKVLVCLCLLVMLGAQTSKATLIYDFEIFNNAEYLNHPDLSFVVALADEPGKVVFDFRNESTMPCAVTEIYFDSNVPMEIDCITNSIVDIENRIGTWYNNDNVRPKNLPAANLLQPVFQADDLLSVQPYMPVPKWGINPGENLRISFNLNQDSTFADVIEALNSGRNLRIGIRIQCLGPEDVSVCAVNNVPEPSTIALLGAAALALVCGRRTRTLTRKEKT